MPLTDNQHRFGMQLAQMSRGWRAELDRRLAGLNLSQARWLVLLHLARKAFYPGKIPFPLLHVDTTWKFKEMIAFRDRMAKEHGFELLVHINPDGLAMNVGPFSHSVPISPGAQITPRSLIILAVKPGTILPVSPYCRLVPGMLVR